MNFKNSVEKSVFPLAEYFQFSRKLFRLNQRCFFLRTKTWTFLHASLTTWFDRSYSRKCYIYKQEKRKFFSLSVSLSLFLHPEKFLFFSLSLPSRRILDSDGRSHEIWVYHPFPGIINAEWSFFITS